jgi:hypothetical protein
MWSSNNHQPTKAEVEKWGWWQQSKGAIINGFCELVLDPAYSTVVLNADWIAMRKSAGRSQF